MNSTLSFFLPLLLCLSLSPFLFLFSLYLLYLSLTSLYFPFLSLTPLSISLSLSLSISLLPLSLWIYIESQGVITLMASDPEAFFRRRNIHRLFIIRNSPSFPYLLFFFPLSSFFFFAAEVARLMTHFSSNIPARGILQATKLPTKSLLYIDRDQEDCHFSFYVLTRPSRYSMSLAV